MDVFAKPQDIEAESNYKRWSGRRMESDVSEWFCSFNSSEVHAQVMPVSGTTFQIQTAWKVLHAANGREGNGNPLQYSCLENLRDRGAWWAAVYGVAQSQTRLKWLSMHACIGEGNGNPLQYSCLENPRDRGAWWAAVYSVAQSQTRLKWLSMHACMHWRRKWQPTPVFLSGASQGQRSLVGCRPWGHTESDTNDAT